MTPAGLDTDRIIEDRHMHVGLTIYGDLATLSGGYLYDRRLVEYLEKQGDSVEVISLPSSGYLRALATGSNIAATLNPKIDILIQDELVHPSVLRANHVLKKRAHLPVIGLVHLLACSSPQAAYRRSLQKIVERRYLLGLDGVILNSRHTREAARTLTGDRLPPHIVAVPAGDNFGAAIEHPPSPRDEGPLRILYVGSITRQKGLDVLLKAVARIAPADFRLTITGRADMEPGYVRTTLNRIRSMKNPQGITMTGPLTGDKLRLSYQDHDLLVLPSVNEAYGIVYLEAMQFGIPVIGTSAGGASEIICHGENGYLIPPGDDRTLSGLLEKLHHDRQLLARLGKKAHQSYLAHPDWEDTGRTIRCFLQNMLTNGGSPS